MSLYKLHPLEQYHPLVYKLEVCRDLTVAGTTAKAQIALILLDNPMKVVLFRLSEKIKDYHAYLKWIQAI